MSCHESANGSSLVLREFIIIYTDLRAMFGGDRFHSIIIKNSTHLKNACFYINENPARAGIVVNPLDFQFNTVSIVKKRIRWNHDWDIFEDLPKMWKKIIRSLINFYSSAAKKARPPILINERKRFLETPNYCSFFSSNQKWCRNGGLNIEDKTNMGNKFEDFMKQMAQENLKILQASKKGIWSEYGTI